MNGESTISVEGIRYSVPHELIDNRVRARFHEMSVDPHPCEGGEGEATGLSPVDHRKTGSKHQLICGRERHPFRGIITATNVNDVTRILALPDGIPPATGKPGRPRGPPVLLHQFNRLAAQWERRLDLHDAHVSLALCLICWRCLKKARP